VALKIGISKTLQVDGLESSDFVRDQLAVMADDGENQTAVTVAKQTGVH